MTCLVVVVVVDSSHSVVEVVVDFVDFVAG